MANKNIRGITIEIGGDTTKLGKAIEDSEKKSKSLQTELREIDKALKFDPTNVELLAQKQTVLTQNVEETSKKLDTLKEAEKQVIEQFKNGDVAEEQVRALQREIIKTEGVLGSMKKELSGTGGEANELAKSFNKVDDSTDDANGGFTIMKGALADLTANAIQSAISAIGDFISSLFELSEATEEYRVMQSKLSGSADTFGYSVDFANEKYKEFYGYLGDDQMSTNAITNLMGLGTSTENISKIAEGAIGVWASYGDSIPIESLTESINETINAGKVTGTFADSINWCKDANEQLEKALGGNKKAQDAYKKAIEEGLPVEDAFNEALSKVTDTQERADIVAQFLNSTYGESKTKYDELSGSITEANRAELELKDTQSKLGSAMEPVNTAITNLKAKALEAILPVVIKVSTAFLDMLTWLKEHPVAMQVLTAVVVALATAFGVLAVALGISTIISGVTKAIALLNTTLLANPIVLIVSLIAGLVAGFITLWNNCDGFREFFENMWEGIKNVVSTVVEAISGFLSGLWDGIKNIFGGIGDWFGEKFSSAKENAEKAWEMAGEAWTKIKDTVTGAFSKVGDFFKNKFTEAKDNAEKAWSMAKETWTTVKDNVTGAFSTVGTWFKDKFTEAKDNAEKAWSMAKDTWTKVKDKVTGAFSTIGSWFKTKFTEAKNNASKAWDNAKNVFTKVKDNVTSAFSTVGSWFKNKFTEAKNNASTAWSNAKTIFTGIKDKVVGAFSNLGSNLKSKFSSALDMAKEGFSKIKDVGSDIVRGLWNGISDMGSWIKEKISGFGEGVLSSLKSFFGINSPSKLMADEVGKFLPQGIAVGIDKNAKSVLASVKDLTNETVDTAKKSLSGLSVSIPKVKLSGENITGNKALLDYETSKSISNVINAPDTGYHADNMALTSKMDEMIRAFKNMKQSIVLDSGVLVGETINQFDEALGNTYSLRARRV